MTALIGRAVETDLSPLQEAWEQVAAESDIKFKPLNPRVSAVHGRTVANLGHIGLPDGSVAQPTPEQVLEFLLGSPDLNRDAALSCQTASTRGRMRVARGRGAEGFFVVPMGVYIALPTDLYGGDDLLAHEVATATALFDPSNTTDGTAHLKLRLGKLIASERAGRLSLSERLVTYERGADSLTIPPTIALSGLKVLAETLGQNGAA